jgi:hypothetical protein
MLRDDEGRLRLKLFDRDGWLRLLLLGEEQAEGCAGKGETSDGFHGDVVNYTGWRPSSSEIGAKLVPGTIREI